MRRSFSEVCKQRSVCVGRKQSGTACAPLLVNSTHGGGARLWRVLLALVIAGVLLVASGVVERHVSSITGTPGVWKVFSSVFANSEANLIASNASWQKVYSTDLPQGFAEEVFSADAFDFAVSDDGSTVGFVMEGTTEEVLGYVQESLVAQGWTAVESGSSNVATFVKREGKLSWLGATFTQVGESVSVVMVLE